MKGAEENPEMAGGGGRENSEQRLRDAQVDRHRTGRMGSEVATQGQGPSDSADEGTGRWVL